ncbi:MAG TPA: hypothetical protein VHL80_18175 [Polyangia bacterium]|nr:hypothetical protein [Polyangia bacterium]
MDGRVLEDLVTAFRARTLAKAEWTHAAHLSVGACYVSRHGAAEALARLRAEIPRLNERHGTPNTATSGYHETITAAFVRLLEEGLATFAPEVPLERRLAALLAGPLGGSGVLLAFWSRDLLMSPGARAAWVDPDLRPLAFAALPAS